LLEVSRVSRFDRAAQALTLVFSGGACLLYTSAALAQAANPAAAEAAAAMERAQRQAANPMRVILQAARIKRAPGAENSTVADAPSVRTVAATGAAVTTTAAVAPAVVAPATAVQPAPATSSSTPPQPQSQAQTQPQQPPAPPRTLVSLSSDALSRSAAMPAAPALEATRAPALPVVGNLPSAAAPQAELARSLARPRLVNMVEPSIAANAQDELARLGEVELEISLRPDGTVATVQPISRIPRVLQRPIVSAVEQWRYEPLGVARTFRVQLAFN
jgi:periplasmic protein TonB